MKPITAKENGGNNMIAEVSTSGFKVTISKVQTKVRATIKNASFENGLQNI